MTCEGLTIVADKNGSIWYLDNALI